MRVPQPKHQDQSTAICTRLHLHTFTLHSLFLPPEFSLRKGDMTKTLPVAIAQLPKKYPGLARRSARLESAQCADGRRGFQADQFQPADKIQQSPPDVHQMSTSFNPGVVVLRCLALALAIASWSCNRTLRMASRSWQLEHGWKRLEVWCPWCQSSTCSPCGPHCLRRGQNRHRQNHHQPVASAVGSWKLAVSQFWKCVDAWSFKVFQKKVPHSQGCCPAVRPSASHLEGSSGYYFLDSLRCT